jgi:hypothetical protein
MVNVDEKWIKMQHGMLDFLEINPEFFRWRGKQKPDLSTRRGRDVVLAKLAASMRNKPLPSVPKTVPDEAVSTILSVYYGFKDTDRIKTEHLASMAAENFVGYLLERYIWEVGEAFGWIWCHGEIVNKVDFIKAHQNGTYTLLQIKNRDNSENSSSKSVRDGTDIKHWFRTFSRTGETNWPKFPDPELKPLLSEAGFTSFVMDYLAD